MIVTILLQIDLNVEKNSYLHYNLYYKLTYFNFKGEKQCQKKKFKKESMNVKMMKI